MCTENSKCSQKYPNQNLLQGSRRRSRVDLSIIPLPESRGRGGGKLSLSPPCCLHCQWKEASQWAPLWQHPGRNHIHIMMGIRFTNCWKSYWFAATCVKQSDQTESKTKNRVELEICLVQFERGWLAAAMHQATDEWRASPEYFVSQPPPATPAPQLQPLHSHSLPLPLCSQPTPTPPHYSPLLHFHLLPHLSWSLVHPLKTQFITKGWSFIASRNHSQK